MRTIVVGYDGTRPADLALGRAAELAEALGSRLIVTTALPLESAGELPDLEVEELGRARALLAGRPIEVEYQPALGEPADTLVEVAEKYGADTIVVGTRDPGAVQRILGQSVSQAVLRHAGCNVLVVRR